VLSPRGGAGKGAGFFDVEAEEVAKVAVCCCGQFGLCPVDLTVAVEVDVLGVARLLGHSGEKAGPALEHPG